MLKARMKLLKAGSHRAMVGTAYGWKFVFRKISEDDWRLYVVRSGAEYRLEDHMPERLVSAIEDDECK